jgi:hypothetical protein
MWIVMAAEQPAITAVISRMPNPTIELAAFGYAFALALFIEGPVVQMLSAGTAIPTSRSSYRKILSIMHALAVITTFIHMLLCLPGLYRFLAIDIMHLPHELLRPSYRSFLAMIPWTAAVGYRRLWQGVMIRYGRSREVPIVMYIRMAVAAVVLGIGLYSDTLPGALLGGLTLTIAVIAGAVAAWGYTRGIIRDMVEEDDPDHRMTTREMISFYVPLGLTSLITLGVRPLLNFGIARGLFPLDSLALWPVVLAYMFIYTSISLSLQEIVIAQLHGRKELKIITSFVIRVASVMSVLYALVLFSPALQHFWFSALSQIPGQLFYLLPITLGMLTLMPLLSGIISLYRGILVSCRKTRMVTAGVLINVSAMLIFLNLGALLFPVPGIYIAAGSYLLAFVTEVVFLSISTRVTISECLV